MNRFQSLSSIIISHMNKQAISHFASWWKFCIWRFFECLIIWTFNCFSDSKLHYLKSCFSSKSSFLKSSSSRSSSRSLFSRSSSSRSSFSRSSSSKTFFSKKMIFSFFFLILSFFLRLSKTNKRLRIWKISFCESINMQISEIMRLCLLASRNLNMMKRERLD